jgi:hypothetical protein
MGVCKAYRGGLYLVAALGFCERVQPLMFESRSFETERLFRRVVLRVCCEYLGDGGVSNLLVENFLEMVRYYPPERGEL